MGLGIALADVIAGDLPEHHLQAVLLGGAAREDDTAPEDVLQPALLDMEENRIDELPIPGRDDLRDIADRDIPVGIRDADLQDLVAVRPETFRLAYAEAPLDLLREFFLQGALRLDITGDRPATERDGCVVAHDTSPVDSHRGDAGPDIDEGDPALKLFLAEGGLRHHLGKEVRLVYLYPRSLEDLLDGQDGLSPSDEDLELPFDGRGESSDDLPFRELHPVFQDEGLGDGSIDSLMLGIRERIGLQGVLLDGLDLFRRDVFFRVLPLQGGRGRDLGNVVTGKPDDNAADLDHERLLRICYGPPDGLRGQHGYVDGTGLDPLRRELLVVDDVHVPLLDPGDAEPDLCASQVKRCEVLFFKRIHKA